MRIESHGKYWVTQDPLPLADIADLVVAPGHGALATFTGTVRTPSGGREVRSIFYEAYEEMAEDKLAQIGAECVEKYGAGRVAMAHRVGELGVGEASVVIAIGAARRRSALDACAYAIERIKELLPVWKKERFVDGSEWVGWAGAPTPEMSTDKEMPEPHQERSRESDAP